MLLNAPIKTRYRVSEPTGARIFDSPGQALDWAAKMSGLSKSDRDLAMLNLNAGKPAWLSAVSNLILIEPFYSGLDSEYTALADGGQ